MRVWGVGVDLFLACYYKLGTDLLMGSSTDITWMGFSNTGNDFHCDHEVINTL